MLGDGLIHWNCVLAELVEVAAAVSSDQSWIIAAGASLQCIFPVPDCYTETGGEKH